MCFQLVNLRDTKKSTKDNLLTLLLLSAQFLCNCYSLEWLRLLYRLAKVCFWTARSTIGFWRCTCSWQIISKIKLLHWLILDLTYTCIFLKYHAGNIFLPNVTFVCLLMVKILMNVEILQTSKYRDFTSSHIWLLSFIFYDSTYYTAKLIILNSIVEETNRKKQKQSPHYSWCHLSMAKISHFVRYSWLDTYHSHTNQFHQVFFSSTINVGNEHFKCPEHKR